MTNIPQNNEHWEAGQADVDRKRHDLVATLPRDAKARVAAIEEACRMLEEAKVPFLLVAAPEIPSKGVLQYHRHTYLDRFSEEGETEAAKFGQDMTSCCLDVISKMWHFNVFLTDTEGNAVGKVIYK